METAGPSPKKLAATVTALVAPYVVGVVAKELGIKIDVDTATAVIGPLVTAGLVYAAAHFAKPGAVFDPSQWPDPDAGDNPPVKPAELVGEEVEN